MNRGSKFRSKCFSLLMTGWLILITIVALSPSAVADENKATAKLPISSGSEIDYPPFCIVDVEGNADGFSVELLRAALAAMGSDVTFRIGPWAQVRSWLEQGEIQVLPLVGRTAEREMIFDFTFPYMSLYGAIVVRQDSTDIQNFGDLKGRQVAVMKGDNAEEFLRREDRGIKIHTTVTFQEALRELSEGRHDAVVIQRLVALRLIQETGLTNLRIINRPIEGFRQDFCFAVREGDREMLALLNEGLALVMADGTYRHLHARWFGALELPSGHRIIVGGDHNYPPYEYLDENGQPTGFNVELTRAIAHEMNLDIEIRLGPWSDIVDKLEKGEIDAIEGMFYSPERDLKFDFTPPHLVNQYVSVVRKGAGAPPATLQELEGKRIVLEKGDVIYDFAVQNGLQDQITVVETQEDVLKELAEGRQDCGLVVRVSALYLLQKNKWTHLTLGKHPFLSTEYCYAVPNNHKALLSQFSAGLKVLDENGDYRRIYNKWLGIYENPYVGLSKIIRYLAMTTIPLLVLLAVFFLWSWSLRKQVARRTVQLAGVSMRHQAILSAVPDIIMEVDADKIYTWANQAGIDFFGEDVVGNNVADFFVGEQDMSEMLKPLFSGDESVINVESWQRRKDGQNRLLAWWCRVLKDKSGKVSGALSTARDITESKRANEEREKMQMQLLQAQKMESVGRLAGGVAHDFNNMIGVIIGFSELAMDKVRPGDALHADLKEILQAANRATVVTRQLLAFARKQTIAPRVIDLNETVEGMLKMLRRVIGENLDLLWKPGKARLPVKMDPSQIDQILANLCVNARDAIADVGKVTIETGTVTFDVGYCADHAGFIPGNYVLLAVSDDGCGMDMETLDNIFEPFFTTKGIGKGTGLGLATVYGIVKQNNGFINVYSEPKKGTTFKIYLPHHAGLTEETGADDTVQIPTSRGETVLIVEDDASILKLSGRMLADLGYTVLSAGTPGIALDLAGAQAGRIHLLITDVIMPEMNGRDLSKQLQMRYPDLKTVFMSGYTANVIAHRGVLEQGVYFIPKPFSKKDLAIKIRAALDSAQN